MEYSYPDIQTMRGVLEEYDIECAESPLSFIQGTYKVIMTIKHPKTHPQLRDYLSSVIEDYIYADGERQREINCAKLAAHEKIPYENGAFYDGDLDERAAQHDKWMQDAIDRDND